MKVAIAKCSDYSQEKVDPAVSSAIKKIGGIKKFVKKGDKVLLKINHLMAKEAKFAVTTHPAVVRAVIDLVRSAGGIPSVGDSPAIQNFESVTKKTGIFDLCKELDVDLVGLDQPVDVHFPNGKIVKSFPLSKKLDEFDVLINMPKLKTHMLMGLTLAVKNLFGCIPGKLKGSHHLRFNKREFFSEMLIDLHNLIKPDLNIMDAVIGMEGEGPGSGDPRKIGAILASSSAFAMDAVAANLVGFKPEEVFTIKSALKRGIADADIKNVSIVGDKIKPLKRFKRPKHHKSRYMKLTLVRKLTVAYPKVDYDKCIKCGRCVEVCPAKAITMGKDGPVYDYDKCIRCYCCHEICPEKAISLKRKLPAKLLKF